MRILQKLRDLVSRKFPRKPDTFRQMHDWDYTKRDEACFKEMLRERGYGPEILT